MDRVEQQLLIRVFRDDSLELARQFQYKAMLQRLGGISDLPENVADEVLEGVAASANVLSKIEIGLLLAS